MSSDPSVPPRPVVSTQVTILLADIRGFTALLEAYSASLMVDLLNRFFATMCDAVERYGGRLDKFMGDSVMAVFAGGQTDDHLRRALACAAVMQQNMVRLNRGHEHRGEPELFAGIAVHTGTVMAGTFGPPRHRTDTVIGEAVNLASRMESFSLRGQVLISEAVQAAADGWVELGPANQVRPKGVDRPVTIYPMRAVHYLDRLVVPTVEPRQSPRVRVDLDALFRRIRSKRVADEPFVGHVDDIGYFGLSAELPRALPTLSEIAVELPLANSWKPSQLYARVVRSVPEGRAYRTNLEFTVVDTPAHRHVKALVDDSLWRR